MKKSLNGQNQAAVPDYQTINMNLEDQFIKYTHLPAETNHLHGRQNKMKFFTLLKKELRECLPWMATAAAILLLIGSLKLIDNKQRK